jgi:hypothetical protein
MIDYQNLFHEVEALHPLFTVAIGVKPTADARQSNVTRELDRSLDDHACIHNAVVDHFSLSVRRMPTMAEVQVHVSSLQRSRARSGLEEL